VGGFLRSERLAPNPTGIAEILIIVNERLFNPAKDPGEWAQRGTDLRAVVNRLGVTIEYHSEYDEHFIIEKTGHNLELFRHQDWLGRFVAWNP